MPRRLDRQIFVSIEWLVDHLHDATLRIMDARFVPPTAAHPRGDAVYAAGHIPGAIFVHWPQDLSTNTPPVPNRLLEAEAFAAKMGQYGVDAATTIIIYDPGNENWAARIWWALKYYGHDQVYVLQGGATAWQAGRGTPGPRRSSSRRLPPLSRDHVPPCVPRRSRYSRPLTTRRPPSSKP